MSTIVAAIAGGLITLGGLLLVQRFEQGREERRRRADEERGRFEYRGRVQDEKRERMRRELTEVLVVARALLQRAKYLGWVSGSAAAKQPLDEGVDRMIGDLERSIAALLLETDAQDIVRHFDGLRRSYLEYRFALEDSTKPALRKDAFSRMTAGLLGLEANLPGLEQMSRHRLALLEQPPMTIPNIG